MKSATVLAFDKTPLPTINFETESIGEREQNARHARNRVPVGTVPAALEAMPHLTSQIVSLWRTRELNTLIHSLLLDSRDGARAGFPHEVAKELMFLAKLNLLIRAEEAAGMLGTTLAEACRLIEKGDHAAIAHGKASPDRWGSADRSRVAGTPRPTPATAAPSLPAIKPVPITISPVLQDAPPLPPSVCLDLTTPRTLRHESTTLLHDHGDQMDQGFFRCIAKELGTLKIPQLVLSDLGHQHRCTWLPAAVSFAKTRCHFGKVVVQSDPLSADEQVLGQTMAAGLDHLVLHLNLASGKWRARAESACEANPDHFPALVQRLLARRDEVKAKTGHHCQISLIQINHKSVYHLSQAFSQLAKMPGLVAYHPVAETMRGERAGNCHCWSPFIEAHVRTNGHLVACAQDHSGYSFTADLKSTTFTEAWHNEAFRKTRHRVKQGEKPGRMCEICPHRAAPTAP